MKEFLRSIFSALLWALMAVLLFLTAGGIYQRAVKPESYTGFFGIGYAVVVSGSMRPVFEVDDMILYQERARSEYREGDIIVYVRQEAGKEPMLITHRTIEVGGDHVVTKGDANTIADEPVPFGQVVGRVVWRVPKIGKVVTFMHTWKGLAAAGGIILLLLLLNILLDRRSRKKLPVRTPSGEQFIEY